MPIVLFHTSVANVSADFEAKVCAIVEEVLGVPSERVGVLIETGKRMYFKDSSAPFALCTIKAIQDMNIARKDVLAKKLSDLVQASTNIESSQFLIDFVPLLDENVAICGMTLPTLNKQ